MVNYLGFTPVTSSARGTSWLVCKLFSNKMLISGRIILVFQDGDLQSMHGLSNYVDITNFDQGLKRDRLIDQRDETSHKLFCTASAFDSVNC